MTRLRHERQRRGWSQLELGYKARIQPSEISRIESGRFRPYPAQLLRLIKALNYSGDPARLLDEVEEAV